MRSVASWPLTIGIVYTLFVLIFVSLIVFSTFVKVDLVTDNYYEQEIKYQQQIDRIQRANSLSTPIRWSYTDVKQTLTLQFPSETKTQEVKGSILFFRPSDSRMDKKIALNLAQDRTQTISTNNLSAGFWKLKIFWIMNQTDYYQEGNLVIK
jgi:hypothetical protein